MQESLQQLEVKIEDLKQVKQTFLLNIAVNCSEILLKSSWIAVELPMKVEAIFKPLGGISQTAVLMLLGIHSTK